MLHNTLQTNATQMTPQARGTAVAIFSSAIFIGQTVGVGIGALVIDRLGAVPLFVGARSRYRCLRSGSPANCASARSSDRAP